MKKNFKFKLEQIFEVLSSLFFTIALFFANWDKLDLWFLCGVIVILALVIMVSKRLRTSTSFIFFFSITAMSIILINGGEFYDLQKLYNKPIGLIGVLFLLEASFFATSWLIAETLRFLSAIPLLLQIWVWFPMDMEKRIVLVIVVFIPAFIFIKHSLLKKYLRRYLSPKFFKENRSNFLEMVNEPRTSIYGSTINIWRYSEGNRPDTKLLVTGHAHPVVCRQVSALLFNTFLKHKIGKEDILLAGAAHVTGGEEEDTEIIKGQRKIVPLPRNIINEFIRNVKIIADEKGLVEVRDLPLSHYEKVKELIQQIISDVRKSKKRRLIHLKLFKEEAPILCPFYLLASGIGDFLKFSIPVSLFSCSEFDDLVTEHRATLLLEMRRDALRRKFTYNRWLYETEEKKRTIKKKKKQERENQLIKITTGYDFTLGIVVPLDKPREISFQDCLVKVIPEIIKSCENYIKEMDKLLKDIDEKEKEKGGKIDEINEGLLIDSLLRNWDLTYADKKLKEIYSEWKNKCRERVWFYIYRYFFDHKIALDPIIKENVVFQIVHKKKGLYEITPYFFLDSSDSFLIIDLSRGLIDYDNFWLHRQISIVGEKKTS